MNNLILKPLFYQKFLETLKNHNHEEFGNWVKLFESWMQLLTEQKYLPENIFEQLNQKIDDSLKLQILPKSVLENVTFSIDIALLLSNNLSNTFKNHFKSFRKKSKENDNILDNPKSFYLHDVVDFVENDMNSYKKPFDLDFFYNFLDNQYPRDEKIKIIIQEIKELENKINLRQIDTNNFDENFEEVMKLLDGFKENYLNEQNGFVEELAFESDNIQTKDKIKEVKNRYSEIISTLPEIYSKFKKVNTIKYDIEILNKLDSENISQTNIKNINYNINYTVEEINNIIILTDLKKFVYNIFCLETLFKLYLVNSEIEEQNLIITNNIEDRILDKIEELLPFMGVYKNDTL